MNEINQASLANNYTQKIKLQETTAKVKQTTDGNTTVTSASISSTTVSAEYTQTSEVTPQVTYSIDFEKVQEMKDQTDQRMFQLFKESIDSGFLKQAGGLRGVLDRILKGESVEGFELNIEVNEESIAQAKEDVAEGGYWSPEETSERFMDFAKALSGNNPEAADTLINAFKEGYAAAEEIWGGELPEISQKTYDLTLEKFDAWKNGGETAE